MRPRLTPPARALARAALRHAGEAVGHVAWRTRHPATRERFVEQARPTPLPEYWYAAEDGWRAPLRHVAARAGAPGEPVVLAHAVGAAADAFRYGAGPTLASALAEAGFSVFLLGHRGDRVSLGPSGRAPTDFDAILERDLPAALARIQELSGFPLAHWVGHGLGGQLGLAAAADGIPGLATVVALASPVRFPVPRGAGRRAAVAASLVPAGWPIPVRWMARFAAPMVGADADSPGARLRGAALHATDDVAVGLLAQVAGWVGTGVWSSRGGVVDRLETLRHARVPLLALCGDADPLCPVSAARPAIERWGGEAELVVVPGFGHFDGLFGARAPEAVFGPIAAWLDGRRRRAWGPGYQ